MLLNLLLITMAVSAFDLPGAGADLSADPRSDDIRSFRPDGQYVPDEAEPTAEQKPAQRRFAPTTATRFAPTTVVDPRTTIDEVTGRGVWLPSRSAPIAQELSSAIAARQQRQAKAAYQTVMQQLTQQAEQKRQAQAALAPATPEQKPASAPQPTRAAWKDTCEYPAYTPAADAPVDPEAWTEVKKGRKAIKTEAAKRAAYYNPTRIETSNYWNEFGKQMWADECEADAEASLAKGNCDMPTFGDNALARAMKRQSKKMHKADNAEIRRLQAEAERDAELAKIARRQAAKAAKIAVKGAAAAERHQANKPAYQARAAMQQSKQSSGRTDFPAYQAAPIRTCAQTVQDQGPSFMDMSHYQRPMPLA